jgi:glutamate 5-kinase
MTQRFDPASCPRLVLKIGSSLLVGEEGKLRRSWLTALVSEIADRRAEGQHVIVVTSGAIALGARLLGLDHGGRQRLDDAQAAAAAGQIVLAHSWSELLAEHNLHAAQMLVTLDDLEDRRRYLNAAATLERLLKLGAVPIINENDSVATEEIRFGDNDRLAARVAQASRAQGIILLSDVDGLHDADPRRSQSAELIREVAAVDASVQAMAEGASKLGSGGMISKLDAAKIATSAGIPLAITSGIANRPLGAFAGSGKGTIFAADDSVSARDAWLAGRLTAAGKVMIDSGAAIALANGKSLLPAGATGVTGQFERGDVVDIVDDMGKTIARGLTEYDSIAVAVIKGRKTVELEPLLGYAPRPALIHRDHLVQL